MRAKEILGALILIPLFAAAAGPSVYEQFSQKITQLEEKLHQEKSLDRRYEAFLATHAELVKLRKNNPRQNEVDELSMSLFLDTLQDLPPKKKFDSKKCSSYQKKSKTMMASRDKEQGDDPMVTRAWKLLDSLCVK